MGQLFDIIQDHIDRQPYPPSVRQVALALEVAPTTLTNWRSPTQLVSRRHLVAIAQLTRVPYSTVLDALLHDIGYLPAPDAKELRDREQAVLLARGRRSDRSDRSVGTTQSDQSGGRTEDAG